MRFRKASSASLVLTGISIVGWIVFVIGFAKDGRDYRDAWGSGTQASIFCFWGFALLGLPASISWHGMVRLISSHYLPRIAVLSLALCIAAFTCSGSVLNIEGTRIHQCISYHQVSSCFRAGSSSSVFLSTIPVCLLSFLQIHPHMPIVPLRVSLPYHTSRFIRSHQTSPSVPLKEEARLLFSDSCPQSMDDDNFTTDQPSPAPIVSYLVTGFEAAEFCGAFLFSLSLMIDLCLYFRRIHKTLNDWEPKMRSREADESEPLLRSL